MLRIFKEHSNQKINVIWVASYPRSGNTWVNTVLKRAGKNYGFPQDNNDVYKILAEKGKPEVCSAVREKYADNPCSVLKTHSPYNPESELHKFGGISIKNTGFIHVYRNPLDVLLSYINFSRGQYQNYRNTKRYKRGKYKKALFIDILDFQHTYEIDEWQSMSLDLIPQRNLDHALDYFSDHGLDIKTLSDMAGSWITHIESWKKAHLNMKGFSIRYEDCLVDREQFVTGAEFFKFGREDVLNALEAFNKKVREFSSSGSIFYNKMEAYYFFKYFSRGAIQRFMDKNEGILRDNGYSSLLEMI